MIICFTGTGNSLAVARELRKHIGDEIFVMRGEAAAAPGNLPELCLPEGDSRVVWVFPVYSWGVPPVVVRFIREIKVNERFARALHHMVVTCGDDIGMTDRVFRKLIGARGWKAAPEAYSVIMPNTYTLMKGFDVDSPELASAKLASMPAAVAEIASAITGRKCSLRLVRGAFPRLKTAVVYPWFKRFAMSPEPFHSTDGCTVCGLCARECPLDNITMTKDGPEWGANCAMCLRCYHICPRHSVAYGKTTNGKGQYICPLK